MRILVTGASGGLGAYVLEHLANSGHEVIGWSGAARSERCGVTLDPIDLTNFASITTTLDRISPDVILHLAAITSAAVCLRDPSRATAINVGATSAIADWCQQHDRRVIFTSTDLVFSGETTWNRENDPAVPTTLYGRTKQSAEGWMAQVRRGLVVRLPLLYGPSKSGRPGFFDAALADLNAGKPRAYFDDEFRTPLDYESAASILVALAYQDESGILHVAGSERMSRFEMMSRVAAAIGFEPSQIRSGKRAEVPGPEPRPADVSLSTSKLATIFPGARVRTIEEAACFWV